MAHDAGVSLLRIDHVQLAMPAGQEAAAAAFYEGVLGLPQMPKPAALASRGGCWFERGEVRVHLGVEEPFRPARKAHPAFVVDDLATLVEAIEAAGLRVAEAEPLAGQARCHAFDPFGNRIELVQLLADPIS
jgi:catechol 2,3-dioxygenase-like lactoylglutathione lyase family enzyme